MNDYPKNPSNLPESESQESGLLELACANTDGWNTEDLRQVCNDAHDLNSRKTAARIKAIAKLNLISKQCGHKQNDLASLLFSLNSSNRLIREASNHIVVEVAANFRLPKLPLGYGFKGGAARIALAHVIGRNTKNLRARDFDLVRFSKGSVKQDKELASRIMPEDFEYGNGVEIVASLDEYFKTRDLSINEVLLIGKKVIFSRAALDDLRFGNLRACADKLPLSGLLACKILRFAAEFAAAGIDYKLIDFPKSLAVSAFDFELHRKRAAESSVQIEKKYIELCNEFLKVAGGKNAATEDSAPSRPTYRALRLRNEFRKRQKRS